jgi:hypothetical protein
MKSNEELQEMTLREIMEYSRRIPIKDGGLQILLERIVEEIEKQQIRMDKLFRYKCESKHEL